MMDKTTQHQVFPLFLKIFHKFRNATIREKPMKIKKITFSLLFLYYIFFSAFLPVGRQGNDRDRDKEVRKSAAYHESNYNHSAAADHLFSNNRPAENDGNNLQILKLSPQKNQKNKYENNLLKSLFIQKDNKQNILYDWLLSLIENSDFEKTYQDFKKLIMDLENLTSFWDSFDFSEIQEGFSLQNQNFILLLADGNFPESILRSIVTWGQTAGFSDFKETDLTSRFFLPIRSKEFVFSPDFSIRTFGNITNLYDDSKNKIGSITRYFDEQVPDQIRFIFRDHLTKQETDIIFIGSASEFLVLINAKEVLRINLDSVKKAIFINENEVPANLTITFSPAAKKITLQLAESDMLQTAELQLDQLQRNIRLFLSDDEMFSLQFIKNSEVHISIQENRYLIKFDDRNHQIKILPDDKNQPKLLLRFDLQKNRILMSSYQSLWSIEKIASIQLNKRNQSIVIQAQNNPDIKIHLDSRKHQVIFDNGFYESEIGPDILEELLFGFQPF